MIPNARHAVSDIPFIALVAIGILPAPLKRLYYRMRGAKIGKRVQLGMFSYIQSQSLFLSDDVKIAPFTFIRTREKCHIGARSSIKPFTVIDTGNFSMGKDSTIREQVVVGGMQTPRSSLCIGNGTRVFPYCFINTTEAVIIEDGVCIGGATYIFTHGSWQSVLDGFPASFGPVTIRQGAWIAWRVFIMPNVIVGEYATVGTGSVVNKPIEERTLAAGVPAKPIKRNTEYIHLPTPDQQHDMLICWLKEFTEYLCYTGLNAHMNTDGNNGLHIFCELGTLCYQRSASDNPRSDISISLTAIPPELRKDLSEAKCGWFDIATRECCNSGASPLWSQTREFFLKYGLRFEVID